MKKTIIALLALSGIAMGAEETFDAATKTATIALTLDVDALKSISDVSFDGATETPNFFMFNGSWQGGDVGSLGIANNGSSTTDTTGLYGSWVKGSSSGQATETGLGSIFTSSTAWEDIDAVSLVYSYSTPTSGATTTNLALSIKYEDGTVDIYGDTKSNVVFSGVSGFAATSVTINDDYVSTYEVSTNFTSLNDVKSMSAALVPEPTTATLSLLALAGLAARRRRR